MAMMRVFGFALLGLALVAALDVNQLIFDVIEPKHGDSLAKDVVTPHLGSNAKLVGTFASDCFGTNFTSLGRKYYLAAISTRRFTPGAVNTVQIDNTQYFGDPACKPNNSLIFSKIIVSGSMQYNGDNVVVPGASRLSYRIDGGTYFFGSNVFSQVIQELNTNCPCGSPGWFPGVPRNVSADMCQNPPVPPTASSLCQMIAGKPLYGSYMWTSTSTYIASATDPEQNVGWTNPLNSTYLYTNLPENGDTNPADCDYIKYNQCGPAIQTAASACKGCIGLECEGCLFNNLPASVSYDGCCPCFYFYANKYNVPWMRVSC